MKKPLLFTSLLAASFLLPVAATHAQQPSGATPPTPPAASAPTPPGEKTVTLDAHDAPVRQVLTQLFDNVKVDYAIDNAVTGFVTLKVTDQPFENVLRLVLRSASVPLTFTRTNGIYEVKPRLVQTITNSTPVTLSNEPTTIAPSSGPHYAVINLTYLDPWDVKELLGITLVPSGTRGNGGSGSPSGGTTPGSGSGLGFGSGSAVGGLGGNGTGGRIIGGSNNGSNSGGLRGR